MNYKNTRSHVIVVLRVTKHFTCAVAVRNVLEPALDKDGQCAVYGYYVMQTRYYCLIALGGARAVTEMTTVKVNT